MPSRLRVPPAAALSSYVLRLSFHVVRETPNLVPREILKEAVHVSHAVINQSLWEAEVSLAALVAPADGVALEWERCP